MSIEDARTGLKSGQPGPEIPYSVSMPTTLGMAMEVRLQVLTGVDPFDLPALTTPAVSEERPDVDDPLALLAGDASPVIGVGGVRQVLVLLELVPDRRQEVVELQPLLALAEEPLDGHLLGPGHDVLDHGARVEVLEVQDLFVAGGVGHLEEAVLLAGRVHLLNSGVDH